MLRYDVTDGFLPLRFHSHERDRNGVGILTRSRRRVRERRYDRVLTLSRPFTRTRRVTFIVTTRVERDDRVIRYLLFRNNICLQFGRRQAGFRRVTRPPVFVIPNPLLPSAATPVYVQSPRTRPRRRRRLLTEARCRRRRRVISANNTYCTTPALIIILHTLYTIPIRPRPPG